MSYQQMRLQHIQQFVDMAQFNPLEVMRPPHHMQMLPMPGGESQNNGDDSDEEDDEENRTLFCANLDDRVTEEILYELFLQAGPIEKVRIPKDNNGRRRTFGFITYVHRCSPPYAMHLYQGLTLFRKTLTIKFQGCSNPSSKRNSQSSGNNHSRYDNSSLRGGNYNSYDSPPQNPFKRSTDVPSGSGNRHDNISKLSHQTRLLNSSPYNRRSGGSEERYCDRDRNHDKRRNHHNGNNRHSNQRNHR